MARTLCYSVRLESLVSISDRAFKARGFDGSEDVIPKSQVFGPDYSVTKSDAYWIAAWLLEKKHLQYSKKKKAWFDASTRQILPNKTVTTHIPSRHTPIEPTADEELTR